MDRNVNICDERKLKKCRNQRHCTHSSRGDNSADTPGLAIRTDKRFCFHPEIALWLSWFTLPVPPPERLSQPPTLLLSLLVGPELPNGRLCLKTLQVSQGENEVAILRDKNMKKYRLRRKSCPQIFLKCYGNESRKLLCAMSGAHRY